MTRQEQSGERIEYVDIPGCRLWTVRQGTDTQALVLCHGGPGLWDYLGPVASMVDDLATVYRFDQRGCGRSTGGPPFDLPTAVADLEALREHWGIEQWIVGGHSWGADLALAYCLEHPERAKALIYFSGTGIDPAWHEAFLKRNAELRDPRDKQRLQELDARRTAAQGKERAVLDREWLQVVLLTDVVDRSRARELVGTIFPEGLYPNLEINTILGADGDRFTESSELPEKLAAMRLPTLVVHGERDPRPYWSAEKMAKHIPGARFVLLPGMGHMAWLDHPDLLRDTLREFMESL